MNRNLRVAALCAGLALSLAAPVLAQKTKQRPAEPPVVQQAAPASERAIPVDTGLPTAAVYFDPEHETTSSATAHNADTGLHAGYSGHGEPFADNVFYARCVEADCTSDTAWQKLALDVPRATKIQLALTPAGMPRILASGWSDVNANGTAYYYGECNTACLDASNWTLLKVAETADGVMDNIFGGDLPERNFGLDAEGRPRFAYTDANYHVEPDHYGLFYMSCDADCGTLANWVETNLANHVDYATESFNAPVLGFAADGKVGMLDNVYAFNPDGSDTEDGIYYYECLRDCTTKANWQRTRVIEPGSGSYPNPTWDFEMLPDGRPRIALFAGYGMKTEGLDYQLIYAWCDDDCTETDGANWYGGSIGLGEKIGESPDLEMTSDGKPVIALLNDASEIAYAYCKTDCENPDGAAWEADFGERTDAAAADRPTALPFTCDGEVWNGHSPSLTLIGDQPMIGYELAVDARCLYKEVGRPEITYEFHEIWRGARFVRVKL